MQERSDLNYILIHVLMISLLLVGLSEGIGLPFYDAIGELRQ